MDEYVDKEPSFISLELSAGSTMMNAEFEMNKNPPTLTILSRGTDKDAFCREWKRLLRTLLLVACMTANAS